MLDSGLNWPVLFCWFLSKIQLHNHWKCCLFPLSVFGFVNETFTADESTDSYRVEVAFFSGRAAFGGFAIFLQYNAGSASKYLSKNVNWDHYFAKLLIRLIMDLCNSSLYTLSHQSTLTPMHKVGNDCQYYSMYFSLAMISLLYGYIMSLF